MLLRGVILFFGLIIGFYIVFNTAEYYGNFDSNFRKFFFFTFWIIVLLSAGFWILKPLSYLLNIAKNISDEEAARQIGNLIPEISDKLINTLQLSNVEGINTELIQASIEQKISQLSIFDFSSSVKFDENKRFLPFLLIPLVVFALYLIFTPNIITESTKRIVAYEKDFPPQAPFEFVIKNSNLEIYKNEDITIELFLKGRSIPPVAFIHYNGLNHKMETIEDGHFSFTLKQLDKPLQFKFQAAGFFSERFEVNLKYKPVLKYFEASLQYPSYIGKKDEKLVNVGNLLLPIGTKVNWLFEVEDCNELNLTFNQDKNTIVAQKKSDIQFKASLKAMKSDFYNVELKNDYGSIKDKIQYSISVVADEYPKIQLEQFKDTVFYSFLAIGGNLQDDYGITELNLFYKIKGANPMNFSNDFMEAVVESPLKAMNIPVKNGQNAQSFYFRWNIDSLRLMPNQDLEYYLAVWDNDAVNGRKRTLTPTYHFKLPSKSEIASEINKSAEKAEKQLESTLNKAEILKKDVKKLEQRLKGKKQLDWQDKKAIEDLLKKQESLTQELENLKEKNEEFNQKKDRFDQTNERIAEKSKLLQQLMDEILDEDTKKLYQELAKLLQEKGKENDIKELVEKLKNKDQNVEKELDRALEMFKQLKFETKLEDVKNKLEELSKKQDQLAEKSLDKNQNQEELKKEQDELNTEFKEAQKELEELNEINDELENKNNLESTEQKEQEISQEQQKSSEELDKKDNKKASKSQKNAAQKMQQMADQMKKMQESMESDQLSENIEDLRAILENLLTLSFNQEEIMKDFRKVNQTDPRFVVLSQQQIKLKDDSKIIEDSLNALAKRVFQIQSFINKELENMNLRMDESVSSIKARRADQAAGKQQMALTSMNNLALLLSDVLKQMQEQQSDQQQQKSGKSGQKKKNKGKGPSMSQLQKNLNKKIEDLKKSGMQGKQLSQELSKLAREQEQIRNQMNREGMSGSGTGEGGKEGSKNGKDEKDGKNGDKDGKQKGEGSGQGDLEQLKRDMEKTESDLVNKQLTQQMLNRQQDILNRLLEHEKAQRERELDNEREAKQAKERPKKVPNSIEQYLKEKEKQIELLKTIPPSLNPYYKQKVNEYFEKLNLPN